MFKRQMLEKVQVRVQVVHSSETIKTLIESSFRFIFTFRIGIGFEISHSQLCKMADKSEQRQNAQKHRV